VFPSTEENQNQEKDKSYVRCKVCQKVMRRKSYQQVSKEIKISIPFLCVQHKQKHDGEDRKFGCSYCETKFRKSEHLQEHMKRFHEQSRISLSSSDQEFTLFRCTVCSRQFNSDDNLGKHMKSHYPGGFRQHLPSSGAQGQETNELRCKICCKQFTMKYNFKRHLQSSHGEQDTCDESDPYMFMK